ncbi:MAG: toxin co-regulated pilus biosynthesis Q family protein [Anaerolineae bacterium]|nr:toxin co-regulated pilus biosynthesis Q family protein [Anaerolineae bacterium]MCZ2112719.1 toxin co-regulated pilus biosynthesis Q family protein [Anaerolineae bacterium]MCZ2115098.1 toxin co-regulated pilus biosynthesis Q family protein [Anaerolineae bacterium]
MTRKVMLCFAAMLALPAGAASAQERSICGGLADYDVRKVSFSNVPLREALSKITNGMPWQVVVNGGESVLVSATDVSGPLGLVLDKLAAQTKFTYSANRCVLSFDFPQQRTEKWKVRSGDKISEVVRKWAAESGWQVDWSVPDMVAEAEVSLAGSFEEAVTDLINALNKNGAGMRPVFYDGNKMLRVTERN